VLVTVVSGLLLAFILGLARYVRRRLARAKVQAAHEYEDRTVIRVGALALARELKSAAEISQRCQAGNHVPSEASKLHLIEWPDRSNDMARLRDEGPRALGPD
jgi:hypothetical protein